MFEFIRLTFFAVFIFGNFTEASAAREKEQVISQELNSFSPAQSPQKLQDFRISGWTEVLVSVRELEPYTRFFKQFETWKLISEGIVSKEQLLAWQLASTASATYRLYANSGTSSGFIRLVHFDGVEREVMRPDSQSWDTGGIFDINMRSRDLDGLANSLRGQGWQARSVVTQFSFGPFVVKEWIAQNSDGLAVAFIERLAPTLLGWPQFKTVSRPFNSTQVVRDMSQSLRFYEEILGFKRYLEHHGASELPGENVLGLPHNLNNVVERNVYVLHPKGINEGAVELLAFDGVVGRDNSTRSVLPNIGIGVLAFPVSNIEALQSHLEDSGVNFVHRLKVIDGLKKIVIRAPEGAWLEFYERQRR